ncbi:MAG: hypothetical protein SF052_19665 [Bacteroidia bacterium]|nr:hypothetical protein [Bacteroidia bacterium]
MEDMFKKFFYTGVGIASLTAEKLQEVVDELIGKGKVSKEEGKKIVDDFKEKVDVRKEEIENKIKDLAGNLTESLNIPKFVSKDEFDALISRIEALEAKMGADEAEETEKKSTTAEKKNTKKS